MDERLIAEADALIRDSGDHHFYTVYNHLLGKEVDPRELYLSVGFFLNGRGRHATIKPWTAIKAWDSEKLLEKLKRDTGRGSQGARGDFPYYRETVKLVLNTHLPTKWLAVDQETGHTWQGTASGYWIRSKKKVVIEEDDQ